MVAPEVFAPAQRGGGWGPFADSFLRLNEAAIVELGVSPEVARPRVVCDSRSHPAGVRARFHFARRRRVTSRRSTRRASIWVGWRRARALFDGLARATRLPRRAVRPGQRAGGPAVGAGRSCVHAFRRPATHASSRLSRCGGDAQSPTGSHRVESVRLRVAHARAVGVGPVPIPRLGRNPKLRRMLRWGVERVRGELMAVLVATRSRQRWLGSPMRSSSSSAMSCRCSCSRRAMRHLAEAGAWSTCAAPWARSARLGRRRARPGRWSRDGWSCLVAPPRRALGAYVEGVQRREVAATGGHVASGVARDGISRRLVRSEPPFDRASRPRHRGVSRELGSDHRREVQGSPIRTRRTRMAAVHGRYSRGT